MLKTWVALLSSRKFWLGTITVLAISLATYLRAINAIQAESLLPFIIGVTTVGTGVIGSIGLEDAAKKYSDSFGPRGNYPIKGGAEAQRDLVEWIKVLDLPHYVDVILLHGSREVMKNTWRTGEEEVEEIVANVVEKAEDRAWDTLLPSVEFLVRLESFKDKKKVAEHERKFTLTTSKG